VPSRAARRANAPLRPASRHAARCAHGTGERDDDRWHGRAIAARAPHLRRRLPCVRV